VGISIAVWNSPCFSLTAPDGDQHPLRLGNTASALLLVGIDSSSSTSTSPPEILAGVVLSLVGLAWSPTLSRRLQGVDAVVCPVERELGSLALLTIPSPRFPHQILRPNSCAAAVPPLEARVLVQMPRRFQLACVIASSFCTQACARIARTPPPGAAPIPNPRAEVHQQQPQLPIPSSTSAQKNRTDDLPIPLSAIQQPPPLGSNFCTNSATISATSASKRSSYPYPACTGRHDDVRPTPCHQPALGRSTYDLCLCCPWALPFPNTARSHASLLLAASLCGRQLCSAFQHLLVRRASAEQIPSFLLAEVSRLCVHRL